VNHRHTIKYGSRLHQGASLVLLAAYFFYVMGDAAIEVLHRVEHAVQNAASNHIHAHPHTHHLHYHHHHSDHHHHVLDLLEALLNQTRGESAPPAPLYTKTDKHFFSSFSFELHTPTIPIFHTVLLAGTLLQGHRRLADPPPKVFFN
jgi:hypothetical protein